MKKNHLLLRLFVLVTAMMCALGAAAVEAYANYTPSNTTLTFYYDKQRASRTGTTYDLNTGNNSPGWFTDGICANVTKVVFDPSFADARPTTTRFWFFEMKNLQSIQGLRYLKGSSMSMTGVPNHSLGLPPAPPVKGLTDTCPPYHYLGDRSL